MQGGFRERLAGLGRAETAAIALLAVVLVAGAGVWYVRSLPGAVEVTAPVPAPAITPSPGLLVVHVAGRVRSPGVYELPVGARVVDAIEAAGGPRKDAALDGLNLAAPLADGQQVLVPAEAPAVETGEAGMTPIPAPLVNLNTASLEELETLPGIGPVLAQRISEYRQRTGPFTSIEQLMEVSGIGEKRFEALREVVTV